MGRDPRLRPTKDKRKGTQVMRIKEAVKLVHNIQSRALAPLVTLVMIVFGIEFGAPVASAAPAVSVTTFAHASERANTFNGTVLGVPGKFRISATAGLAT